MEQTTECAITVEAQPIKVSKLLKLYYLLTAHIPRQLPRNKKELEELAYILINYYGLPDKPDVWFTVSGQITSTPATKTRKPYSHIVNAARRLGVNALARALREDMIKKHEDQLKALTEMIVEAPKPDRPN